KCRSVKHLPVKCSNREASDHATEAPNNDRRGVMPQGNTRSVGGLRTRVERGSPGSESSLAGMRLRWRGPASRSSKSLRGGPDTAPLCAKQQWWKLVQNRRALCDLHAHCVLRDYSSLLKE